jgi:hypothetical protein
MDRSVSITGKSKSTLTNYGRHLASMVLHYGCMPTELAADQVMDYLHLVKANGSPHEALVVSSRYLVKSVCQKFNLFSC